MNEQKEDENRPLGSSDTDQQCLEHTASQPNRLRLARQIFVLEVTRVDSFPMLPNLSSNKGKVGCIKKHLSEE